MLHDRRSIGKGNSSHASDLRLQDLCNRRQPQPLRKRRPAEQNTNVSLRYAHYGYILENGRVVLDGAAASLRENEDAKEFYLGIGGEGRRSFRDVKHYRRRKRWL